jgi:hypothetical protein
LISNKRKKSCENIKTSGKLYIKEKQAVTLSHIAQGFSVLSHDHEANRLLPLEVREKIKWYSFYEMIYLLNRETAISDQEAKECIRSLGQVPNFTLPAAIRQKGFPAIKEIFDKKYPPKNITK